jgi:hypothetical protein
MKNKMTRTWYELNHTNRVAANNRDITNTPSSDRRKITNLFFSLLSCVAMCNRVA